MRKLKLSLEALRVETFGTLAEPVAGPGTVLARGTDDTLKPDCDVSGTPSCAYTFCDEESCFTCAASFCGQSCIFVCDGDADADVEGAPGAW